MSPSGFSNHAIHFVRTIQTINVTLSQMADAKASLLMGATFLVFTIAVGQAKSGSLQWPLTVLALFAFLAALCAVFAVLPSVGGGKIPPQSLPNRLFFGYFTQLPEEQWIEDIVDDLRSDEAIFRLILHDIYQNGMVLQRKKYRYLGLAYRIFMAGLCLTVFTFILEFVANHLPRG
ncbi:MAG: hypothetical protein H7241_11285 [Novosphingobium sp.]|nr:hypothetical protein [Novosphingobium sp.]